MTIFNDLIGKSFKFGARGPKEYDCWGLATEVCKRLGIIIPDYGADCVYLSSEIHKTYETFSNCFTPVSSTLPGDIITFCYPLPVFVGHIGVVTVSPYFLHTREKTNVVMERLDSIMWKKRINGIYRYKTSAN